LAADGPLQLRLIQVEQLGASSVLRGMVGTDTPFELVCPGQTALRPGDTVALALPVPHLHCFDANGQRL
jgi:ABC-type sugar transport system ATPase subunit